uniref:Uncharacterized LOC103047057 n=1 Tax=Astyanax mexicanus TaxID=7994 RepID=A0A3B1IWV1_ASTMX
MLQSNRMSTGRWKKRNKGEIAGIVGKGFIYAIDYYDRPGTASAKGLYAEAGAYATGFVNKFGQRIPKAGASAAAGVGKAQAEWRLCEAEANGPNASAGAYASVIGVEANAAAVLGQARAQCSILEAEVKGPNVSVGAQAGVEGVGAMARAEFASASASAGIVGVKVGVGFDTGAELNPTGAEVKFLGSGFSLGRKMGISYFGSELSFNLW